MKIKAVFFAMVLATFATIAHTSVKSVEAVSAPTVDFQLEEVKIEVDRKVGATIYTIGGEQHFEFEPIKVVGKAPVKTSKVDRCKNPTVEDLYDDAWLNACIVVAKG